MLGGRCFIHLWSNEISKILVIGASSFTGNAFVKFLREREQDVTTASLRDFTWPTNYDPEYVVNFAAANVVAPSWDYPVQYMDVNVQKQIPIWFRIAASMARYLHISTPEVYGNAGVNPIKEDQCFSPSTPYAVSRAGAEMMLKAYSARYGLRVAFTRAANAYGPGQQLYRLIPKLIMSVRKGIRFPLDGGGNSYRQFVHIDDLCAAYWRVMLHGKRAEAYHVGSNVTFRIETLVKIICSRLQVRFEDAVSVVPERHGKDPAYILDSTKLISLGWVEEKNINKGIDEVMNWIDDNWEILKDQPMNYEFKA